MGLGSVATCCRYYLHPPPADRVSILPAAAVRFHAPDPVDGYGVIDFQPVLGGVDHCIGGINDVLRGAVILQHRLGPGAVVLLEFPDVRGGGAGESVDVLVVVAHGEEVEPPARLPPGASCQCRYEIVGVLVDVLVLVDEQPREAGKELLPQLIGVLGVFALALQVPGCLQEDLLEYPVSLPVIFCAAVLVGAASEPHGQGMAGEHGHTVGLVADQVPQPPAYLRGGVAVVGQGNDALGPLPSHLDQVGDAVHQHPGLARAGPGQHQHVGIFPGVGDDPSLHRVVQLLHDPAVVLRRGLQLQRVGLVGQPLGDELLLRHGEVVFRHGGGVLDPPEAAFRILLHDVDLLGLLAVVPVQRLVVLRAEGSPLPAQLYGHGGPQDGHSLAEADDLLVVEPEQRLLQDPVRVHHGREGLGFPEDPGEFPQGGVDQQVRAPLAADLGRRWARTR